MKHHTKRLFFFTPADDQAGSGDFTNETTTTEHSSGQGGYFDANGSFVEGWVDRLPTDFLREEDREAFRVHAAKYKNPLDAVKSDFHKERILGRRGVPVPGESSSPEEVAAFRKAVGAPERVEDYQLRPDNLPQGMDWNDDLARPYAEIAHKYHIPAKAMQEMVAIQLSHETARMQQTAVMVERELNTGRTELREAFGSEYDRKISLAQRAAASVGVDARSRGFLDPAVVKGFVRLAEMIDEDRISSGSNSALQGGLKRAKDIMTNPTNPYHQKYQDGDEDTVSMVRSLMQQG